MNHFQLRANTNSFLHLAMVAAELLRIIQWYVFFSHVALWHNLNGKRTLHFHQASAHELARLHTVVVDCTRLTHMNG